MTRDMRRDLHCRLGVSGLEPVLLIFENMSSCFCRLATPSHLILRYLSTLPLTGAGADGDCYIPMEERRAARKGREASADFRRIARIVIADPQSKLAPPKSATSGIVTSGRPIPGPLLHVWSRDLLRRS